MEKRIINIIHTNSFKRGVARNYQRKAPFKMGFDHWEEDKTKMVNNRKGI